MPQHKRKDLTGLRVGRWLVLGFSHRDHRWGRYLAMWNCRCSCGAERAVLAMHLSTGKTTSCGCAAGTHRMTKSDVYIIWVQMIGRCHRPKTFRYRDYGGRGIIVCDRWRRSFSDFYADIGPRPTKQHTIDRLNVDGNYEPGNVRWATAAEQNQNQRRTKLNPEKVLAIRAVATPHNRLSLAAQYGVTPRMKVRPAGTATEHRSSKEGLCGLAWAL